MLGELMMAINNGLAEYSGLISLGLVLMNVVLVATIVQMRVSALRRQQALVKHVNMSQNSVIDVGERLMGLEKRLLQLNKEQRELGDSQIELCFSRARTMLDQGLSDETIAANSGLSMAEVSLLKMVQTQSQQSQSRHTSEALAS
ncbi:DUF2802 domain-containing protein [Agaribacterium haliotis]|uniref:DUF2802 domain-containing protein n=1 Tax=Agaribacterium haliotis TaxID=2013869 RepID=UPI000BB57AFD|nr:DUF2802 domain-containing protein [Agaribacterium haliotis]